MFGVKLRYLFILLLSVYSFVHIIFTEGHTLIDHDLPNLFLLGIILFLVFFIWEGNRIIEKNLPGINVILKNKIHPMVLMLVLSIINVIIIISVICLIFYSFDLGKYITPLNLKLSSGFGFRVNLFLNSLNAIFFFINESKKAQIEAEEFKKISIEAQFQALKTQINPHFLFNSLTALSNLIHKDPNTSVEFINELSKVYRYLLNYQDNSVVKLQEELEFISSYIFLLNIRFRENLFIQNQISEPKKQMYIAPASLQILIENAIKHNIVSKKNPLYINIYEEEDFLVVENNLQEKLIKEPSTNIGLSNIVNRYKFLVDKQVEIVKGEKDFKVKLPLLKLENI